MVKLAGGWLWDYNQGGSILEASQSSVTKNYALTFPNTFLVVCVASTGAYDNTVNYRFSGNSLATITLDTRKGGALSPNILSYYLAVGR